MPMRMRQDRDTAKAASPSGPAAGFAVKPFHPVAPAQPPRRAVEELAARKFGPIEFEGEQHYVRFRILNGRVELGINPEWRDLGDILRTLAQWKAEYGGLPASWEELARKANFTLEKLDFLLRLRGTDARQPEVQRQIELAIQVARQLMQALAEKTQDRDIYGGKLHGDGDQDTDVVGFDPDAAVEAGELRDVTDQFDPEPEELLDDSLMTKADGPRPTLGREGLRRVRSVQAGGQPLSRELRSFFEPRFGVSLAHVRLHADTAGDLASRHLNARAFTLGRHIAFRRDQFAPHSEVGRWLLAHELAHALPGGRRDTGGPPRLGGARDRAEHAADRAADAVMAGMAPPAGTAAAADGVVRRALPKGTSGDPIKIAFFKTKGMYKNFKATGYSGNQETFKPFQVNELPAPKMKTSAASVGAAAVNKQVGGAGPTVKGVRIGVTDPNATLKGNILRRIASPARWAEGIFKTALSQRGFSWAGFAPDHVHDLAMSGPDRFPNLWPLDSTLNSHANKTYQQKVKYQDTSGSPKTNAVSALIGKYFKVTRLRNPP